MDLMTTGEAAKVLGLSADRVRQLSDQGRLPAERTRGGTRLFQRDTVEAERARRAAAAAEQTKAA
jgi:excisionase family DNA binding protein